MFSYIHQTLNSAQTWLISVSFMTGAGLWDYGNRVIYGHDKEDPKLIEQINLMSQYIVLGLIVYKGAAVGCEFAKNEYIKWARKKEESAVIKQFHFNEDILSDFDQHFCQKNDDTDIKAQFEKFSFQQKRGYFKLFSKKVESKYQLYKENMERINVQSIFFLDLTDPETGKLNIKEAANLLINEKAVKYLFDQLEFLIKVEQAFTRGAISGFLKDRFPVEICFWIASFLTIKEGASLAKTCKAANNLANEEKNAALIKLNAS